MLDVLKKADVVDAGGYGLYVFFEGLEQLWLEKLLNLTE